MDILDIFQSPTPVTITGRTSTITNAFVTSIIPSMPPTREQLRKCLSILKLDESDLRCAYCGDKSTEWDHLRPLVRDKKPTGYISDIFNLVPSCGKCNQSKGNKYWEDWITSKAKKSPKSRGKTDIDERSERLKKYEKWSNVTPINFEVYVDKELWKEYWATREKICEMMKKAQQLADRVDNNIKNRV